MRILWLTNAFDDSAVSNIFLKVVPYFPKDWKVLVVSLESTDSLHSYALAQLAEMNIEHRSLHCKKLAMYKSARKLTTVIASYKPNIVHAQLGRAYIAMLLAPKQKHYYYKIATFHNHVSFFNALTFFALSLLQKRFDGISAVSSHALDSVHKAFRHTSRIPSQTVYNPVLQSSIATQKSADETTIPTPKTNLVLLTIGRLIPSKGHKVWISMLPKLIELVGMNFEIWCAGIGPLEQEIINECAKLGVIDNLCMLGYVHDINRLLSITDIVMFPSQSEGFGLVPCEALLSGTPIIAQDLVVLQEILQDDVWLIDCNNQKEFAEKIYDIHTHSDKYEAPLISAQQRIQTVFSPQRIALEYQRFYESFIASSDNNV